jgi:tRNA(fMet)-specific endonuclease VapC
VRYLLDTNTISQLMHGNPTTLTRLSRHGTGAIFISAITAAEIQFGLAKKPGAHRLSFAAEKLLERVVVLDFTPSTAAVYGTLRARLESTGMPMSPLDTLIAATALEQGQGPTGMILVTNDHAFSRAPGLTVEDWTT